MFHSIAGRAKGPAKNAALFRYFPKAKPGRPVRLTPIERTASGQAGDIVWTSPTGPFRYVALLNKRGRRVAVFDNGAPVRLKDGETFTLVLDNLAEIEKR